MDDEDGPTPLSLPTFLPYPLSITRVFVTPSDQLRRGSHLIEYKFTSATSRKALDRKAKGLHAEEEDKDAKEWDMVGTWDSEFEGEAVKVEDWIKLGGLIERKQAGKSAVYVKRPCDHSVQFGGLCAKCGIPLDADDYLSRPEENSQAGPSSKKGYAMSHDAMGVTVSTNEAKRIENRSRNALLSTRKLSLIVDLDQTIIHTTVDPTVGDWMKEIEEQEESQAQSGNGEPSTTPPSSPMSPKEKNPNAEALMDVAKFQLDDDLPPGYNRAKAKSLPKELDRWYYTKPRPGLPKFLKEMNDLYEMHVYTMGTRTYADAICKAVDPDGSIFGGRILTRDESGSFSAKDLKRLFPTDQSMVVIIDDRSDVWSDVPNLVKVVPYDFFIGQGDINAPKTNKHTPPLPSASSSTKSTESAPSLDEDSKIARSTLLNELSEKRPLAKLQAEMEEAESSESSKNAHGEQSIAGDSDSGIVPREEEQSGTTTPPGSPSRPRVPVLKNDDEELKRVSKILARIHRSFYLAYDSRSDRSVNARLPLECDVPTIIPEMKACVLDSCHIVFSGVIPTHMPPDQSDVWRQAETFGATPSSTVTYATTHCVIGLEGTEKAMRAHKLGAKVVWVDWFNRCVALWERLDEGNWLVGAKKEKGIETRPSSGSNTPNLPGLQLNTNGLAGDISNGATENMTDETSEEAGDEWDDDAFLASIRTEAGIDEDSSDSDSDDGVPQPSSPLRSILASPYSRAGSVESTGSTPGTPRKRVRYADEEDRPLSTYREAPEGSARSPPRKKPRALLMPAMEGEVPPENSFQWKGKEMNTKSEPGAEEEAGQGIDEEAGQEDEGESYEPSEAGTEDEFSKMLREELEEEG